MKHYHKNPRAITERQFKDLRAWLKELGDLGGIVHDLNSDEIIGGNQRVRALDLMGAEPVIIERFDPPTDQGTVARGYFERHGERYDYRAVRWTPRQCEQANIVANRAGGDWDWDELANSFEVGDLLDWGFDESELLGQKDLEDDTTYNQDVDPPIYEPKGEKPQVTDLFDATRFVQLVEDIDRSDTSEEEKDFLRAAAHRHVVFHYENIAEYYAHSPESVQALMEDSALVIIDFDRAIELGFVKLAQTVAERYKEEYGDEE